MLYTAVAMSAVLFAQRVRSAAQSSDALFDLPSEVVGYQICGFVGSTNVGNLRLTCSQMNDVIQDSTLVHRFNNDATSKELSEFMIKVSRSTLKCAVYFKERSFNVQGYSPMRSPGFTGQFRVKKDIFCGRSSSYPTSVQSTKKGWVVIDPSMPFLMNIETGQFCNLRCSQACLLDESTLAMRKCGSSGGPYYEVRRFIDGKIGEFICITDDIRPFSIEVSSDTNEKETLYAFSDTKRAKESRLTDLETLDETIVPWQWEGMPLGFSPDWSWLLKVAQWETPCDPTIVELMSTKDGKIKQTFQIHECDHMGCVGSISPDNRFALIRCFGFNIIHLLNLENGFQTTIEPTVPSKCIRDMGWVNRELFILRIHKDRFGDKSDCESQLISIHSCHRIIPADQSELKDISKGQVAEDAYLTESRIRVIEWEKETPK